jgi:hypothetical protein
MYSSGGSKTAMIDPAWLVSAEVAAAASRDRSILLAIAARPEVAALWRPWLQTWRVAEQDRSGLGRDLRDVGRYLTGIWAIHLNATPGGLTVGRLSDILAASGMSGAGRARSILLFLRFIRFIEAGPPAGDGRARPLVPTRRMMEGFRARLLRDIQVFWPIDPAILEIGGQFSQDEALTGYVSAIGEVTLEAFRGYRPAGPSLDVVSHRFGGMAVLAELLLAEGPTGAIPPREPFEVSLAGLARDCQISRPQVRGILDAMVGAGLIEKLPDGRFRCLPELARNLDLFIAGAVIVYAYAARAGLARLDAGSDSGKKVAAAVG